MYIFSVLAANSNVSVLQNTAVLAMNVKHNNLDLFALRSTNATNKPAVLRLVEPSFSSVSNHIGIRQVVLSNLGMTGDNLNRAGGITAGSLDTVARHREGNDSKGGDSGE